MAALPAVEVRTEFLAFNGGADFTSPMLLMKPGFAREAQNFEQDVNGGYKRIAGYERFSGKAKPSDANYAVLTATLTGTPVSQELVTGGASGATGRYIATGSGNIVLTATSGTFVSESISGSSSGALGTVVGPAITDGASTALLHATYKNLAADYYRALIAAPTGSGQVRGLAYLNDVLYAWRNNAGGTAMEIYKSSGTGWTAVALGRQVSFTSGGAYVVAEGDTITGATSGATAVITRVVFTSGSWSGGTAAGKLIFASQTGTFQAENLNVGANLNVATIAGNSSAITLANPNGRVEVVYHNFGGAANTTRIYGCDGVNKGFEFDGTVYVPIDTGMTTDAPSHVCAHKSQLFFSFVGSVQHSAPGEPYVWSAVVGASEIAMGDTVTGFQAMPSGAAEAALAIFTRNNTAILYGTGVANWLLQPFDGEAGAYAYSIQKIGVTLMLDDRGITSLQATQNYGNFGSATLSRLLHTFVTQKRTLVTASCIARDKNQYRLFFSDGSALYATIENGKVLGMMPMLFADEVRCIASREMNDGTEAIFFGSDDGFVYQMDKGTSFDGDDIEAFFRLAYSNSGNHRQQKRYRAATFEVAGEGYASFNFSYELGYASTAIEQAGTQTLTATLTPSFWDTAVFDAFIWDGRNLEPAEADMTGTGENVSVYIYSNDDIYEPFRLSGATLTYTPRRQLRANN